MTTTIRLLTAADAPVLAELLRANREFLAPWDPVRSDAYFTEAGQRQTIQAALNAHDQPFLIESDGRPVGRMTLSDIIRGPFQSCHLGYWVSRAENGRGVATAAVAAVARVAFGELGLHRIQAGTLLHNAASQRVLQRNGFTRIGVAPGYLKIAGEWQDHLLHQLLSDGSPIG